MTDPERIWLEPEADRGLGSVWHAAGRPNMLRQSVEYVRADLYEQARAELEEERLRSALDSAQESIEEGS